MIYKLMLFFIFIFNIFQLFMFWDTISKFFIKLYLKLSKKRCSTKTIVKRVR